MKYRLALLMFLLLVATGSGYTQDGEGELAAVLEVLSGDVQVQRVNTVNRISVNLEAVVGVGDTIYTGEAGRARITYFEDGVSTELQPDTIYRIDRFEGVVNGDSFNIRASVLLGRTVQQLQRLLDGNSTYDIETPSMTLAARGTVFEIRVEEAGRAAMLVTEGLVQADSDDANAEVPMGFGVRALDDSGGLSEVVRATTFDELDAALDGCTISITTSDDVSLNVRNSPTVAGNLLGYLTAEGITVAVGINASGEWYRVNFEDAFGWVLASQASVDESCAGLRIFPDAYEEGDVLTPESMTITPQPSTESDDSEESSDS